MKLTDEENPLDYLERLDAFLDGGGGDVPLVVLREQGIDIPDDDGVLDDAALHARLWEILNAMGELGMIVDSTDHLSDRELYRWLVREALTAETFLDSAGFLHLSPIGEGSEEENEIYLRYYADDETRELWRRDFDLVLPPKEKPPYDRDRMLPGAAETQ